MEYKIYITYFFVIILDSFPLKDIDMDKFVKIGSKLTNILIFTCVDLVTVTKLSMKSA